MARRHDDPRRAPCRCGCCRRSPPTAGRSRTSTSGWPRSASSTGEALANWSGRAAAAGRRHRARRPDGRSRPPPGRARWTGAPQPQMNPLETAMWRAEAADPRLRANVTLLELLDPAPDWERLRAAHEWASRMVPRMRQRVVEPALGVGAPALGDRGRTSTSTQHVHRVRLDPPGLDAAAARRRRRVRRRAAGPRPAAVGGAARRGPGRRPGRLRGQDPPQHHRRARRGPADEPAAQPHRRARPGPARAAGPRCRTTPLRRGGAHRPAGRHRPRRRRWPRCAAGARRAVRPAAGPAAPPGRRWTWSARPRSTLAPPRAGSPLLARGAAAGTSRCSRCRSADLKAGAKAAGGSLNDGLLAAVIGGFRRYHERLGAPVGTLTLGHPDQPARARTTRRAATGSPAPASPRRWTRPTRPPGSRAVREFVLSARAAGRRRRGRRRCSPRRSAGCPAPVIGRRLRLADQHQRRPGVQPAGRARAGLHRRLADHPHVPLRPAARLRAR